VEIWQWVVVGAVVSWLLNWQMRSKRGAIEEAMILVGERLIGGWWVKKPTLTIEEAMAALLVATDEVRDDIDEVLVTLEDVVETATILLREEYEARRYE
jgi:hypothetical protein